MACIYVFFDLLIQISVVVGNVVKAVCNSQHSMALLLILKYTLWLTGASSRYCNP